MIRVYYLEWFLLGEIIKNNVKRRIKYVSAQCLHSRSETTNINFTVVYSAQKRIVCLWSLGKLLVHVFFYIFLEFSHVHKNLFLINSCEKIPANEKTISNSINNFCGCLLLLGKTHSRKTRQLDSENICSIAVFKQRMKLCRNTITNKSKRKTNRKLQTNG